MTQARTPKLRIRVTGDARLFAGIKRAWPESWYLKFLHRDVANWDRGNALEVDWDQLTRG